MEAKQAKSVMAHATQRIADGADPVETLSDVVIDQTLTISELVGCAKSLLDSARPMTERVMLVHCDHLDRLKALVEKAEGSR
jgi:hypothetical protein